MDITAILRKYTTGEFDANQTNEELFKIGSKVHIDPGKNVLTKEEIENTTIGSFANMANGWGLLDTGTGSLDKVEVRNGELVNMDCGEMYALCIIAGRMYRVKGKVLVDEE